MCMYLCCTCMHLNVWVCAVLLPEDSAERCIASVCWIRVGSASVWLVCDSPARTHCIPLTEDTADCLNCWLCCCLSAGELKCVFLNLMHEHLLLHTPANDVVSMHYLQHWTIIFIIWEMICNDRVLLLLWMDGLR